MKKIDERRPGGNVEIDELRMHLADELGVAVRLQIALRHGLSPAVSGRAEAGSQIADHINLVLGICLGRRS